MSVSWATAQKHPLKLLHFECMNMKQSMADRETCQELLFFLRQILLIKSYYGTGKVVNMSKLDKGTRCTAALRTVKYQNNTATCQRFV